MKDIVSHIDSIDEIARQTTLLALNASIEAARAGDSGKGFAVVASEVRRLAEHSQDVAKTISDLTAGTLNVSQRAGKLLEEMQPSIQSAAQLVQEISAASKEQAQGISQINEAVGGLNQAVQHNAASSEELSATAEQLGSHAKQLRELMSYFKLAT
jgi:methyl-accepting chemotaxis protein